MFKPAEQSADHAILSATLRTADVAVIVPVYNRATTVLGALESVASQTRPPRRFIVIDDGSTDGTADSVIRWTNGRSLPAKPMLLRQKNHGVSVARNRGIDAAGDCRYLAFLDSDDRWPEDFLERTSTLLDANGSAVAVTCDQRYVDVANGEAHVDDLRQLTKDPIGWMFEHGAGICSASLFLASAVTRLGGFNPQLQTGDDADLFLPIGLAGEWLHAPGEPVTFRFGSNAASAEEGHLSKKFSDRQRQWAQIFERFLLRQRTVDPSRCRAYSVPMSRWWYRAGRELRKQKRFEEAYHCFRASVAWHRRNWKCLYRLAEAYLRSAIL